MPRSAFDRRDGAFSITLPPGGGRIIELITIRGRLHIFREKDIYEAITADVIDPERQHPGTKHSHRRLFRFGCSNPVVARAFVQTKRLLDAVGLDDPGISKEAIIENAFDSMQDLARCFEICQSLADETLAAAQQCDAMITTSRQNDVLLELTQVDALEERAKDFLISAKRFLVRQLSVLKLLLAKPDHWANKAVMWAEQRFGKTDPLAKMLRDDLYWITFLSEARNAIEHPKPDYFVEVSNISLMPGNHFSGPAWRFKIGQLSQENFTDILLDMRTYVENMLGLSEDLVVLCLEKSCARWFPYEFYRLPNEQLDPSCPVAYGVALRRPPNQEAKNEQELGRED